MKKNRIFFAAAIVLAFALSGCGINTDGSENGSGNSAGGSAPVSSEAENSGDGFTADSSEDSSESSVPESGADAPGAQGDVDGIYRVKDEDGGVEIVKFLGEGGEVVIPEQIGGKTVVEIGDGAFRGCERLTSVVIPGCVEDIGDEAFFNCTSLRLVNIHDGVREIGERAFGGTALRGIYIPASVDDIGGGALNTPSLERVEVDENNHAFCEVDGVLFDKNVSKLYCYPCKINSDTYSVPNSVREIEEFAFLDCSGLKTLDIPDTVLEIERGAFDGCTVLTVNFRKAIYTSDELGSLYNDD